MIGIIILSAVFLLILLCLFLPIRVFLDYREELFWKVKFAFFPIRTSVSSGKAQEQAKEPQKTEKEKKDTLFQKLIKQKGASECLQILFSFMRKVLKKIKRLLKHITFHKICFDLQVGDPDAAQTAILYGEVCAAAYPVFSFLDQASNVRYKEISIAPDYDHPGIKPKFSAVVTTRLFFLLVAALGIGIAFLSFRKQVKNDE